mgnify:CR=1 FL=1
MAILLFGTNVVDIQSGTNAGADTGAGVKSPYATSAVRVDNGDNFSFGQLDTGEADFWFSVYAYLPADSGTEVLFEVSGGGTALFRVQTNGSNDLTLELFNGSVWNDSGVTASTYTADTLMKFDVRINVSDTGNFTVYRDGVNILDFSGDTLLTAQTTLDEVTLSGSTNVAFTRYSGFFIANEDTTLIEMASLHPSGNGVNTAWLGDFTDINESVAVEGNFISTQINNAQESYTKAAISTDFNSGYSVLSVGIRCEGRRAATGPQQLQLLCRSGTTDGVSATQSMAISTELKQAFFDTDPDTAAAWADVTAVNNCEIGVKSIA